MFADQPTPRELGRSAIRAALDLSPRTLFDPRASVRYVTTLTTRLVKLQGGLMLRVVLTVPDTKKSTPPVTGVRSIA